MDESDLSCRFRNLLVVLAREVLVLKQEAKDIRASAKLEPNVTRATGLLAKANARDRFRARLETILRRNGAALRAFFSTKDLTKVAQEEIVLHG